MNKAASTFIQEFVLLFGFLNGLWINIGVNPDTEIARALISTIQEVSPNPIYSGLFWLIFFLLTLFTVISSWLGAYLLGGWLGIGAVLLAFLGGICITSDFGVYLLIAGIIVGFIAALTHGGE